MVFELLRLRDPSRHGEHHEMSMREDLCQETYTWIGQHLENTSLLK